MAQKVTVVNMSKKGPVNLKLMRPATAAPPTSHMDKIRAAQTLDELDQLVSKNDRFDYASDKTRTRWAKAEKARRAVLLAQIKK